MDIIRKFNEYLMINEAADYLGVVPNTLRNWERQRKIVAYYLGVVPNTLRNWERQRKIVAYRHPINSYRMYKKEDLDSLLATINTPIT